LTVEDRIEYASDTVVSNDVVTGTQLAAFPVLLEVDVDRAVHAAPAAAEVWSAAGFATRRRAMLNWLAKSFLVVANWCRSSRVRTAVVDLESLAA
jgi:acyl-CoA reductase-like NAD-dependent aldehyde dehydrogenase